MPKILNFEHIGIVMNNTNKMLNSFEKYFNIKKETEEIISINEESFKLSFLNIGEVNIELIEPLLENGMIYDFLQKTGGAIHHFAIEVDDIDAYYEEVKNKNGKFLLDGGVRNGSRGSRVFFFSPEEFQGILVEVISKQ